MFFHVRVPLRNIYASAYLSMHLYACLCASNILARVLLGGSVVEGGDDLGHVLVDEVDARLGEEAGQVVAPAVDRLDDLRLQHARKHNASVANSNTR